MQLIGKQKSQKSLLQSPEGTLKETSSSSSSLSGRPGLSPPLISGAALLRFRGLPELLYEPGLSLLFTGGTSSSFLLESEENLNLVRYSFFL